MINSPASASDVARDGLIQQRWTDSHLPALLGDVTATEVNQVEGDSFQVRYGRRRGPDLTYPATRIARVTELGWEWTSSRMQEAAEVLGVAELWGTHPEQPAFYGAARTILGGAPLLRVDGTILAVHIPTPPGNPLLTAAGLGDAELAGYHALSGTSDQPILRDGLIYDLASVLQLDDLRADATFLSHEHQLLFDAIVPPQPGGLDLFRGQAHFQTPRGPLSAAATVIATVTAGMWTWSWADRHIPHPCVQLREFGMTNTLPVLCTPSMPLAVAQKWDAEKIVKPILGMWTHAFIPLSPETYAVVLLAHPALQLPPARPEVTEKVLASELDPALPMQRAREFYARARGMQLPEN